MFKEPKETQRPGPAADVDETSPAASPEETPLPEGVFALTLAERVSPSPEFPGGWKPLVSLRNRPENGGDGQDGPDGHHGDGHDGQGVEAS